jgi:ketosteroid isomerase-like protein
VHAFRVAIESGDIDAAVGLLADDVEFRSPVVFRAYRGREAVAGVIRAVARVFEDFRYVREIGEPGGGDHALVFSARVGDRRVEGCDFVRRNEDGSIAELVVMVRPLTGIIALAKAMQRAIDVTALPYIDEHDVLVAAAPETVWRHLAAAVGRPGRAAAAVAAMLGAVPRRASGEPLTEGATLPGFSVREAVPGDRLVLVGHHRFSEYALVYSLAEEPGGTRLRARTHARFPGIPGGLYRTLVIGSRGHRVLVRRILRGVRNAAESQVRTVGRIHLPQ